jgi:amidohydrolase
MDALALTETADIPYKSQNDGKMHACGHDGHMAGQLAAAQVLFNQRGLLRGTVKLIFQPAEEGLGGAPAMMKDGVLEEGPQGPRVDSIYGIHLWSFEKLGNVCCRDGPVMAASDKFAISVKGKGGHGAAPQGTVRSTKPNFFLLPRYRYNALSYVVYLRPRSTLLSRQRPWSPVCKQLLRATRTHLNQAW